MRKLTKKISALLLVAAMILPQITVQVSGGGAKVLEEKSGQELGYDRVTTRFQLASPDGLYIGHIAVEKNGKLGIARVDTGELVIPCEYDVDEDIPSQITMFADYNHLIVLKKGGKYDLVSIETYQPVETGLDEIDSYNYHDVYDNETSTTYCVAPYREGGKWGLIALGYSPARARTVVLKGAAMFDTAPEHGYAGNNGSALFYSTVIGGKYGAIRLSVTDGIIEETIVVEHDYEQMQVSDYYAVSRRADEWYLHTISETNNEPNQIQEAESIQIYASNRYLLKKADGTYVAGTIYGGEMSESFTITTQYDTLEAVEYLGGTAFIAELDGKVGLIAEEQDGPNIIEIIYRTISPQTEKYWIATAENGELVVINIENQGIGTGFGFTSINKRYNYYSNDYYETRNQEGKLGIAVDEGTMLVEKIPSTYGSIYEYDENYLLAYNYDSTGVEYTLIRSDDYSIVRSGSEFYEVIGGYKIYSTELTIMQRDGKCGLINVEGDVVVPYEYDGVEYTVLGTDEALIALRNTGVIDLYDGTGTRLVRIKGGSGFNMHTDYNANDQAVYIWYNTEKTRTKWGILRYGSDTEAANISGTIGDTGEEPGGEEPGVNPPGGGAYYPPPGYIPPSLIMPTETVTGPSAPETGRNAFYGTGEEAASLANVDASQLRAVTDATSAAKAVREVLTEVTTADKNTSTGRDIITTFAQEAATRAATSSVNSNEFVITAPEVKELQNKAESAVETVGAALKSGGLTAQRELQLDVRFTSSIESSNYKVRIDQEVGALGVDNIRVDAPGISLSIPSTAIADGDLVINVSEVTSSMVQNNANNDSVKITQLANPAIYDQTAIGKINTLINPAETQLTQLEDSRDAKSKTYNVSFDRKPVTPVKVSLDFSGNDFEYLAVMNENNEPVGGKYNPASDKIEAKITESGRYTIRENKVDFSDIEAKSAEMKKAIQILASKGIIAGTDKTAMTFSPDQSITRAEIVTLIVRALSRLDANADGGFVDVTSNDWYFGSVGSAKSLGITSGTSHNTFSPNAVIAKDQITAMAARTLRSEMRYSKPNNVDELLRIFTDAGELADWSKSDIAFAIREDLVVLRSDGAFIPNTPMTRGEAAIILYRMFLKIW